MSQSTKVDQEFAEHVRKGLSSEDSKFLSSRYFYDDTGSMIFQEIMKMPEYYLTRCEDEILRKQSADIIHALNFDGAFNVVELGAGDGSKTVHILRYLMQQGLDFVYSPIDISRQAIVDLEVKMEKYLPGLPKESWVGDYFEVLDQVISANRPTLVLFLGSNIGNFEEDQAAEMLQGVGEKLSENDKLLLGVDLKKHPEVVRKAYFDERGVTARFNLNLLTRINRELGADFDLSNFDFYAYYDPDSGDVRSCLVSLSDQQIYIDALNMQISLRRYETIRTELSRKYSLLGVEQLAHDSGFEVIDHFTDCRNYFCDSLWVKSPGAIG